jgi:hypothetical protein
MIAAIQARVAARASENDRGLTVLLPASRSVSHLDLLGVARVVERYQRIMSFVR